MSAGEITQPVALDLAVGAANEEDLGDGTHLVEDVSDCFFRGVKGDPAQQTIHSRHSMNPTCSASDRGSSGRLALPCVCLRSPVCDACIPRSPPASYPIFL